MLERKIQWEEYPHIRPVCLPADASQTYEGETATVTGWGNTYRPPLPPLFPPSLQEVEVGVITNKACAEDYGYNGHANITESMLCAVVPGGGKDACQGDSGGPLMVTNGDGETPGQNYYQIGVVSTGHGCAKANYPGIYSRVTVALDWIKKVLAGDNAIHCPDSFLY